MTRQQVRTALFLCLFAGTAGCDKPGGQGDSEEPPKVRVAQPLNQPVADTVEFTGRTDAVKTVGIRAHVTGFVVGHPFTEGDEVKKGQLLFEIDERPYQAQYDQAKAQVASAKASLNLAEVTYNITFESFSGGASNKQELEQAIAALKEARARLTATEASLEVYKLNLEFCHVTSPLDGLVSRYYYEAGNLVNQDQTLLATIVSLDPMYVYFDMDEPTQLRIREAVTAGKIKLVTVWPQPPRAIAATTVGFLGSPMGPGPLLAASLLLPGQEVPDIPVRMGLQTEPGYPHAGTFNFINNVFNPSTGSIPMRGRFDNPPLPNKTRLLRGGMFVRIQVQIGEKHPALQVDSRAIGTQQGTKFVYVLDKDNAAQSRPVRTGAPQDNGLVVLEEPRFKITKTVLQALRQGGIPDSIAAKLENLQADKDKPPDEQAPFLSKLSNVLDKDEMASFRDRILRESINEGLFPDEWMIVTGLKQVRLRTKVAPTRWTMPTIGDHGHAVEQ